MTTQNLDFKIEEEDSKKRLDKFLARKLPDLSRAFLQNLITEGAVLVNGKKKEKKYSLKEGDGVEVFLKSPEDISLDPDDSIKFDVVFENKDFAVINKPAGLVVHPSDSHKKETLVNGLLAKWPEIKSVGEDSKRPGIVHRLDKDTSGLMIIAKTNEMFFWLKEQFKEKKVEKKYTVLVFGEMEEEEGEIVADIARSGMKQVAIVKGRRYGRISKKREARTDYKVKQYFEGATLVEAFPKTGRMHQIRVHFACIGHSVVGDDKYTQGTLLKKIPFKRQFLHASELSFFLPNGEKVEFSVDLSEDLKKLLKSLAK